ncbi:MAG TPA: hypothetical protein VKT30_00305 [Caulobacteraceae bacterium]|nr:hypothetical protein [Caulobacteraceae bacterium]
MTRIVSNAGGVGDHSHGGAYPRESDGQPSTAEGSPAAAASEPTDDVRLIIEGDESGAGFTYITVDRRTGAVIRQLPRESLLELSRDPGYAAGALIRTRA